jgi:hypothetical protein
MDTHPDPNPLLDRPRMGLKRALHLHHRTDAGIRRREHGEEGVPLGVHLFTAILFEGRSNQTVMLCEHPCIGVRTEVLKKSRRPLDVGEEEGKRLRS